MKASEWLKKANSEGLTDYKIAKLLSKPPQFISSYKRDANKALTPDIIRAIAENTSLNAIEITLDQAGEKAKTEESKQYFKHLAKTATAAAIMASTALSANVNYMAECILCSIGKKKHIFNNNLTLY
jgi:predicted ATP-dependent endonuclease of OLD family